MFQIVYTEDVLSHLQATSNHMGRHQENRADMPTPSHHNVAPDFAYNNMAMMSCNVLEQNDTTLQQFWLFKANSPPHLILKDSAVILAIYRRN